MAKKLPEVDVVLVGFGWTASVIAQELTEAGANVLALERGGWRDTVPDFSVAHIQDELRYAVRKQIFEETQRSTLSFRNRPDQLALPMRQLGSFLPAAGVGGAGVHWNGQNWRFLPTDFLLRTHNEQRYGKKAIPEDMTIQDWGVTYEQLEPYYDKWEYLCGISGKAGNIGGAIQPGGNPFEGPRRREYPLPPLKRCAATQLFDKAAREVGFHPFPAPAANTSKPYLNPLGVQMGQCTFCGYCEWFGCANYSKASPQTTILPVLIRKSNFSCRDQCEVTRINLDGSGKQATGVSFVDTAGTEWEQPADLVILAAYSMFNVQLLLLSKIGEPYDPVANKGVIGRNFTHQCMSSVDGFFDKSKFNFNPFIASGAIGMCIDEFNGDNFDHGPLGFVGGGYLGQVQTNGRPIETTPVPKDVPKWGAAWKKAVADYYLSNLKGGSIHGSMYSYRDVYLDLDPTYKDRFGRPLMRMTIDFHENELKAAEFMTNKYAEIVHAMGAKQVVKNPRKAPYDITKYQTTHLNGGAIMGADPKTSALNKYLQSWDVPNLFVMGASAFPQNAGYNPTGTVGALAFWSAAAIRDMYLKNPGPLVHA